MLSHITTISINDISSFVNNMSLYNCADDKVPSFWTLFNFYQNQIQTNLLTDLDDKMKNDSFL
jgi:hypothetical protein